MAIDGKGYSTSPKIYWSNMYCCVYISLTQYAIKHVYLSFKISYLSRDSVLIHRYRFVTALDSEDTERLLTSVGKRRVAAAKLDGIYLYDKKMPAFVLPIGRSKSLVVYGEGRWSQLAQTLRTHVMIG